MLLTMSIIKSRTDVTVPLADVAWEILSGIVPSSSFCNNSSYVLTSACDYASRTLIPLKRFSINDLILIPLNKSSIISDKLKSVIL